MTVSRGIGKGRNSGGPRPGAGRPRGSVNKRTKTMLAEAELSGQLPLTFLLERMRDPTAEPRERLYAASACLPYTAARLYVLKALPDPKTLDDLVLTHQVRQIEAHDAARPEAERARDLATQFERLVGELPRLSPRRQEEFLGRLIVAAESGLQRLAEAGDPPGTVVPRQKAAPAPNGANGRPVQASEPKAALIVRPTRSAHQRAPEAPGEAAPEPPDVRWDPVARKLRPAQ